MPKEVQLFSPTSYSSAPSQFGRNLQVHDVINWPILHHSLDSQFSYQFCTFLVWWHHPVSHHPSIQLNQHVNSTKPYLVGKTQKTAIIEISGSCPNPSWMRKGKKKERCGWAWAWTKTPGLPPRLRQATLLPLLPILAAAGGGGDIGNPPRPQSSWSDSS